MIGKKHKGFAAMALVSLVAMLSLGLVSIPAANAAGSTTVVVTEADVARQPANTDNAPTKSWVIYTKTTTPGTATFRTGPGAPPLGVGSLEFSTTLSTDKVYAFNYDYVGTKLSDISAIGYSTYRSIDSAPPVAALNIQVDFNGDGTSFTTLVFEPVYNTSQGSVASGQWQTWDAYNGGNGVWWSTRVIPGADNSTYANTYVTWQTIVAANPNAKILGGFGINQGSGNPGLTTAVDALKIGIGGNTTIYNFEPSKDQCKDGGWQTVKRADGSSFKNQGDCVSYIKNGK
jgi:hypothetical protein